jgi:hypothetical protein
MLPLHHQLVRISTGQSHTLALACLYTAYQVHANFICMTAIDHYIALLKAKANLLKAIDHYINP